MLRPVMSNRLGSRIMTFGVTESGGDPSASVGMDDLVGADYSDLAAGRYLATFKNPYSDTCMGFLTNSTNGVSNGFNTTAQPVLTGIEFNASDGSGTLVDNNLYAFTYGFDSTTIDFVSPQSVVSSKDASRVIWGQINGSTPAVVIGKRDFSLERTATGTYTITFLRAFSRPPVVMVTGVGATLIQPNVPLANLTAGSCQVLIRDAATGANANGTFNIVVIGQDNPNEQGGLRNPLMTSQRKTRIAAFRFTAAASPALSIGNSEAVNLVANGTGDYTLTLAQPFAREPIVVTTSSVVAGRVRTQVAAVTTSTIQLLNADAAASPAHGGDYMQVFVIGSDDITEY